MPTCNPIGARRWNPSKEMGISESAVSCHTAKLIRRGYADACRAGCWLEFRLADMFKTPLHARLFEILRSEWEKGLALVYCDR